MSNQLKVLTVFGTRPEAIKMAPVVLALAADARIDSAVCVTGQHREMLDQVLNLFAIEPAFDLNIMKPGQDLTDITTGILHGMKGVLAQYKPDVVLVHGDTTTTFATTVAAYYQQIPVAHVEAGLRTGNIYSPWPEEANRGQIHIVEPDLDMVVRAAVTEGYLRATTQPEPADAFLIAVPTPFKSDHNGDHEPDLSYIESSSKSIAPMLKKGDLVILESTSPVGTTEQMAAWLAAARPDLSFPQTKGEESDIRVAYCPERVLPGQVLRELVQNDRVIGGMTPRCSEDAAQLYQTFVQGECVITNARLAEMCKLTENSFRDVNIAFANRPLLNRFALSFFVTRPIRVTPRRFGLRLNNSISGKSPSKVSNSRPAWPCTACVHNL